ncbi:MAG: hypothetical protein FD163_539 [Hyphomonadaceae bacterium]|nr:MAG: hypothetical protein FD163_539 [Hyphomonadaceae bacterium]
MLDKYAKIAIEILQLQIQSFGFTPIVHFELEGGYKSSNETPYSHSLDFVAANLALDKYGLQGELKPEFWPCQWEWASKFENQTPLRAAENLAKAIKIIPSILCKHGAKEVFIKPVLWNGAYGRIASPSQNIPDDNNLPVHVPNSIQINVSALNAQNENAIPMDGLGEVLQNRFLRTSRDCCLLYSPESEAFERFGLKKNYGLEKELSSPHDISGGHQGSIALYKEVGKHNQKLGEKSIVYDENGEEIMVSYDWKPLSRVEHRLGSASLHYNAAVNTVFALANLSDAIMFNSGVFDRNFVDESGDFELPKSLFGGDESAYALFEHGVWFENKINAVAQYALQNNLHQSDEIIVKNLGTLLKKEILKQYGK